MIIFYRGNRMDSPKLNDLKTWYEKVEPMETVENRFHSDSYVEFDDFLSWIKKNKNKVQQIIDAIL